MNAAFQIQRLFSASRAFKIALLVALDVIIVILAFHLAFFLRLGNINAVGLSQGPWLILLLPMVAVLSFYGFGLYRTVLRSMGLETLLTIAYGAFAMVFCLAFLEFLVPTLWIPRSVPAIFGFLVFSGVALIRLLARNAYRTSVRKIGNRAPVLIYGVHETAGYFISAMGMNGPFDPIALIDTNPLVQGTIVHGCRVYPPSQLQKLSDSFGIKTVFVARQAMSREKFSEISAELEAMKLDVKQLPSLNQLLGDTPSFDTRKDISTEHFLGRSPVSPLAGIGNENIVGKTVLVTGGGGSIGAELCKQILALNPRCLVLLERSEIALYDICQILEEQIKGLGDKPEFHGILGSVCDLNRLDGVFSKFSIDTVFHAAAFKHVPIVEKNLFEGIRNNVFGTRNVADMVLKYGARNAILISTDKAVRPTNVMGATKRLAEKIFLEKQTDNDDCVFSTVRFGNVLGSSGSVIPLFHQQIRDGGPITITHLDVVRYFMTIPEAAQLVIHASSLAKGGDVLLLDMGKEVRIADLARRMVELSGLTIRDDDNPEGDIEIVVTGLRPGEKLYEELLIGEPTTQTSHPKILRAVEPGSDRDDFNLMLDELEIALQEKNQAKAVSILKAGVEGYQPGVKISDF